MVENTDTHIWCDSFFAYFFLAPLAHSQHHPRIVLALPLFMAEAAVMLCHFHFAFCILYGRRTGLCSRPNLGIHVYVSGLVDPSDKMSKDVECCAHDATGTKTVDSIAVVVLAAGLLS